MKKQYIFKIAVFASTLLFLTACAFGITKRLEDGYSFGDIYSGLVEDVETYCTNASAAARAVARYTITTTTGLPIPNILCAAWATREPAAEQIQEDQDRPDSE